MEELIVKNISKKFKDLLLFDELNLKIKKGTITGIVGGNGSGKSVLFKLICGLLEVDSGEIILDSKKLGEDFDYLPNTGIFIDSPGFIPFISGLENLKLLAQIKNIITEEDIVKFMELLNLDPYSKTKVKNYSFGMKQKLGIIQAIMENQNIILLDEIFNGLDFKSQEEIKRIIMNLKKENKAIVITSHQHQHMEDICDNIYLIDNYRLTSFDAAAYKKYFS